MRLFIPHAQHLLPRFGDTRYPGLHLHRDGTIVATSYAHYHTDSSGTSIVSVRFKMSEVDAMMRKK